MRWLRPWAALPASCPIERSGSIRESIRQSAALLAEAAPTLQPRRTYLGARLGAWPVSVLPSTCMDALVHVGASVGARVRRIQYRATSYGMSLSEPPKQSGPLPESAKASSWADPALYNITREAHIFQATLCKVHA